MADKTEREMTEIQEDLAVSVFDHCPPTPEQIEKIEVLRQQFRALGRIVFRELHGCGSDRVVAMRELHSALQKAINGVLFRGQYRG